MINCHCQSKKDSELWYLKAKAKLFISEFSHPVGKLAILKLMLTTFYLNDIQVMSQPQKLDTM